MQPLQYGHTVVEDKVLKLQAENAVDIRQSRQRAALDAAAIGRNVF
jgi:hypothetical protein